VHNSFDFSLAYQEWYSPFTLELETEVVALVQQEPTHHITHKFRHWDANIHIPAAVQKQLDSRDQEIRERGRSFVAIRFRQACREKFGRISFGADEFIEWNALKFEALPARTSVAQLGVTEDGRECDDCKRCDDGYHEQCGILGGCPQAYSRDRR